MFLEILDAIDPEDTDLEDIDRLIEMVDELESKCREFNHRDDVKSQFYWLFFHVQINGPSFAFCFKIHAFASIIEMSKLSKNE